MYTIYGIKNCNTMKKACTWLDENKIIYQFHDYKRDGISSELIDFFAKVVGWENLINKKGLTYRNLDESTKQTLNNPNDIKTVMLQNPSIIKRPLLIKNNNALIGFSYSAYSAFVNQHDLH